MVYAFFAWVFLETLIYLRGYAKGKNAGLESCVDADKGGYLIWLYIILHLSLSSLIYIVFFYDKFMLSAFQ